jgi:DNA-binding IclR family transcriptional regulator
MGSGRYSVNAVVSALTIFGKVVDDGSTSLEDAAKEAGVARSTAFRLLTTLTELGLLERLPGGGYVPGTEGVRWAGRILAHFDPRKIAAPVLERLREETNESANFALLRGSELVYVMVYEGTGTLRTVEEIGSKVPLHAAAVGKCVAAFLDEDRLVAMLGDEPYQRFTSQTKTRLADLTPELDGVRSSGYAVDIVGVEPGVACVAAPIFRGDLIAGALSLSGPRARLTDERLEELAEVVVGACREITSRLAAGIS